MFLDVLLPSMLYDFRHLSVLSVGRHQNNQIERNEGILHQGCRDWSGYIDIHMDKANRSTSSRLHRLRMIVEHV